MFNDIGSIYKEIRESKNLTQATVCKNILSRSNLANFESNRSIPSYEKMAFLLRQLDVTFEEFAYICNHYQPDERQSILIQSMNVIPMLDVDETQKLFEKTQRYLKQYSEDIPIRRLQQKLEIALHVWEHNFDEQAHKLAEKIWEELQAYDTWYESDLKMLTTILFHFPVENIHLITNKILDTLERYKDYKNIQPSQFSLLANLSTVYLYEDYIEDCQRITTVLYNLSKKLKRYDYLGIAHIRLGICQNDFERIKKGLDILNLTEETQILAGMKEEIQKYHPTFPLD